ncbi:hypothetical protein LC593_20660 [Nostoc sp. CHAB 5844]|nr:hypothetical protein [Nostoc sp. CHAB 5844]
MFKNNEINNSQLFRELSAQEQECVAAGQDSDFFGKSDFFFQQTNIQTESENKLNLGSESSTQTTKYNLSQITLGTSVTFRWPMLNFINNRWNSLMNTLLKGLFT